MSGIQSSPTKIATISELLALSDSQYRIYDLGRRVDKISKEQFTIIPVSFGKTHHKQVKTWFHLYS